MFINCKLWISSIIDSLVFLNAYEYIIIVLETSVVPEKKKKLLQLYVYFNIITIRKARR